MSYRKTPKADELKVVANWLQNSPAVEGELPNDGLAAGRRLPAPSYTGHSSLADPLPISPYSKIASRRDRILSQTMA